MIKLPPNSPEFYKIRTWLLNNLEISDWKWSYSKNYSRNLEFRDSNNEIICKLKFNI